MALTENKRIQHIVATSSAIATDDFDGRLAYDTTESAIRVRAGGVAKYASMRGHTHVAADVADLQDELDAKADLVGGKVPSEQLPSYVDDVVEVANFAALPTTGETGKIYVTIDTNFCYRWSGSVYVEISASPTLASLGGVGGRGAGTTGQVALWGDANTVTASPNLVRVEIDGVLTGLNVGAGTHDARMSVSAAPASQCEIVLREGVPRVWAFGRDPVTKNLILTAYEAATSVQLDQPLVVENQLWGNFWVRRPLRVSALAGTGERIVSASTDGTTAASIAVSEFAKTLLDDADAAAVRTTLGSVGGRGAGSAGRVTWWANTTDATSDPGLHTSQVSGKTAYLNVGDGTIDTTIGHNLNAKTGKFVVRRIQIEGVNRWYDGVKDTQQWFVRCMSADGASIIDDPIVIPPTAGAAIDLGVDAETPRTIRVGGLSGTGSRAVVASSDGTLSAAGTITREAILQPLPITNNAPDVVNVVDANMKSFGFDGGTQTEELFYHIDTQHDYVAGSDMIFHVHWMPDTATGGNVRFQCHYQWVEAGGTFAAATLVSPVAVAAGTTAWADKRTDFTISGTGHTYNSRLMIRLFRDPTDATDTYSGDAVLSSVGCHYTANPVQP